MYIFEKEIMPKNTPCMKLLWCSFFMSRTTHLTQDWTEPKCVAQ